MQPEAIISAIDEFPLNRGRDGATWLADPANIVVEVGDNLVLFDGCGDGVFEVHFLFVSRGRLAVMAARESFRRIFEDHNAETIFGMVPSEMRHAILMARLAGGRHVGTRPTPFGDCELFVLSREMWKGIDQ